MIQNDVYPASGFCDVIMTCALTKMKKFGYEKMDFDYKLYQKPFWSGFFANEREWQTLPTLQKLWLLLNYMILNVKINVFQSCKMCHLYIDYKPGTKNNLPVRNCDRNCDQVWK